MAMYKLDFILDFTLDFNTRFQYSISILDFMLDSAHMDYGGLGAKKGCVWREVIQFQRELFAHRVVSR
jgi:hypothetical protein